MISLFIDTSISFPTISLVKDNDVLYEFHEEIKSDMSSKILPIIDEGLKKLNLSLDNGDNAITLSFLLRVFLDGTPNRSIQRGGNSANSISHGDKPGTHS